MKLFLTSKSISYHQQPAFLKLIGKSKPEEIKIALIENAADIYEDTKKNWVYESRDDIQSHGFQVDLVDLEEYRLGRRLLLPRLQEADVIWLGGGNTYYLRWILRETRADTMIKGLVARGKVYGGGSAGAIVSGPTLKHFEAADSPKAAPTLTYEGLGLTDIVVVPHWANEKYGSVMQSIEEDLQKDGFKTVHITDQQALVIEDGLHTLVS